LQGEVIRPMTNQALFPMQSYGRVIEEFPMPQIEQEEEGPREEGGAFFITGTNEEQKRREGP